MSDEVQVRLTPDEWEWFKHIARAGPEEHAAPREIRRKLLELKLVEEKGGGVLLPTAQGKLVLRLVQGKLRGTWRRKLRTKGSAS